MITKVTVQNSYGESLSMELTKPELSGYVIAGITGLDPVNVDIKQTQMVSGMRYRFNKGFFKYRQIKFSILYYEYNTYHKSIPDLRRDLYKYFKTNDQVTLYFEKKVGNNTEIYEIKGVPDQDDTPIFNKECGATISVICSDPWFKKINSWANRNKEFQNTINSVAYKDENENLWYNYIEPFQYNGNIKTSFKLTTKTDVRVLAGKNLILKSQHSLSQSGAIISEKYLNLHIPQDIPDRMSVFSLYIDMTNDSISVYGKHNYDFDPEGWPGGQGVPSPVAFAVPPIAGASILNDQNTIEGYYDYDDHYEQYDIACSTDNNKLCGAVDLRPDAQNSLWYFTGTDPLPPYFMISGVTQIQRKAYPMKASGLDIVFFGLIMSENGGDQSTDDIWDPVDRQDVSFYDGYGHSVDIGLGCLISDINMDPQVDSWAFSKLDGSGWIDANDIAKRGDFPDLNQGYNKILFDTEDGWGIDFKIEYNEYYRGL